MDKEELLEDIDANIEYVQKKITILNKQDGYNPMPDLLSLHELQQQRWDAKHYPMLQLSIPFQ